MDITVRPLYLGISANWSSVQAWLDFKGPVIYQEPAVTASAKLKCPEIQSLQDYSASPPASFWQTFPKNPIPTSATTPIDVERFSTIIDSVKDSPTFHQILRAKKCISYLTSGAPAFQSKHLPPIFCKNVPSTAKHGQLVTYTIRVWVKKKFASGPFDSPPSG